MTRERLSVMGQENKKGVVARGQVAGMLWRMRSVSAPGIFDRGYPTYVRLPRRRTFWVFFWIQRKAQGGWALGAHTEGWVADP